MGTQGSANGVNKCGSCGSSEVSFDGGWLVCRYCHNRWNTSVLADELRLDDGIEDLTGTSSLVGAKHVDTASLITVKCDGCGAAVTANSEITFQVTCPWCRQVLTLNDPVDNGAIPDAILPFAVTRDDALRRMQDYVSARASRASAEFLSDFEIGAIQAVYLPYLVVDGKVTVRLDGRALAKFNVDQKTFSPSKGYYVQRFNVMREVDLLVNDLAIEARSTRTRNFEAVSTTNIINAIQPFDVRAAVRFDASYIAEGIVFEKRDMEVAAAMGFAADHFTTIARVVVNPSVAEYSGVRWEAEQTEITGSRWLSMLLPVWIYEFTENAWAGPMRHYIAVNGRTGETEGSIPVGKGRKSGPTPSSAHPSEGSVPPDDERAPKRPSRWKFWITAITIPLLIVVAMVARHFRIHDHTADLVYHLALSAVPFVGIFFAFEVVATFQARAAIARAQRNPEARLKPEIETQHRTTRLVRGDQAVDPVARIGFVDFDGGNDQTPHIRLPNWFVTVTATPAPGTALADDAATGGSLPSAPVDGPKLPPPSTTVLSVGW